MLNYSQTSENGLYANRCKYYYPEEGDTIRNKNQEGNNNNGNNGNNNNSNNGNNGQNGNNNNGNSGNNNGQNENNNNENNGNQTDVTPSNENVEEIVTGDNSFVKITHYDDGGKAEEYIENGLFVRRVDYSANGDLVSEVLMEYKENGGLIKQTLVSASGSKMITIFDGNGNQISQSME